MTLHYHGTPITPREQLWQMAGKCFCVSMAAPADAETCLRIGQSVLWDSGAFSAFTKGKPVEWPRYYRWLEPRLAHPHWAVVPDVIDGAVEEQRVLAAEWPFPRSLGAPVWHLGLPVDYLLELTDAWPRVCFGSSGAYWAVGSEAWERRCDEAFNALARRGPLPWVHMLRGMALAGKRWPFASIDSTNVAQNFKRNTEESPGGAEYMARALDAVQCPITWATRPEQQELVA